MGPSAKAPGTESHESVRHSLVHATQAPNRISRDLQMESQIEHTWRTTNPWDQLLGHLHPSHHMACHLFLLHFVHNRTLENTTIGLHHGFSTSTHTDTALHEYTKGIQNSQI